MPMNPGEFECPEDDGDEVECTAVGMTAAIYAALKEQFEDDVAGLDTKDRRNMHKSWCKLALAIATGVINHIKENMEIRGIDANGEIPISGTANVVSVVLDPVDPEHTHPVTTDFPRTQVTFT